MQIMLNLAKQRNPTFVQSFDRNQQAVQGKILFKFNITLYTLFFTILVLHPTQVWGGWGVILK